jgi:hypothetical protein
MNRRELSKTLRALLTACAFTGTLLVAVSAAQDIPVRVYGRVQWIAGGTMVVALDDSPSVKVDLAQVAQDQYAGLAQGDRVLVTGLVPNDGDRVVATSIRRRAS